MFHANVDNKCNTKRQGRQVFESLTENEQIKLRSITIGHGNMAACQDATGKDRGLIMRAMQGGRLLPENVMKIRAYLNAHQ